MTETKNTGKSAVSDNRISTHPSYKEYSWDALVGNAPKAKSAASADSAVSAGIPSVRARAGRSVGSRRASSKAAGVISKPSKASSERAVDVKRKTASAAVKAPRVKTKVNIHTIAVEKRYAFPVSIVLLAICFTLLIVAIVTTSVQINEITQVNSDLENQYNKMVSEENELRLLLETRDDLRVVEQMAKEELGMVKVDQVERYYLTVHQEDKIEIIEDSGADKTGLFDGLSEFGNSIVERIRGFFGM